MRAQPVAVHVTAQFDDPATARNEAALIVWGLADDSVDEIEMIVGGDERRVSPPGRDGAFIAAMPPTLGNVTLILRRSDGDRQTLSLPPAPDLAELNRKLRNGEIPRHEKGGP
ncbi:MAG: hypothetical protein LC777_06140 [Actinobacteria bacterium]|nr:hypothetical protein [Actinomycetota bacterium]